MFDRLRPAASIPDKKHTSGAHWSRRLGVDDFRRTDIPINLETNTARNFSGPSLTCECSVALRCSPLLELPKNALDRPLSAHLGHPNGDLPDLRSSVVGARIGSAVRNLLRVEPVEEWRPLPHAPQWGSYEEVTRELVDRLARANGVQTTPLTEM